jgi:hypothetical protein
MKILISSQNLAASLALIFFLNSCAAWDGKLVFSDDFDSDFLRKHYWDYEEGCEGNNGSTFLLVQYTFICTCLHVLVTVY